MPQELKLQQAIDRTEIYDVVAKSVIARDSGLWDRLAECHHPDAKLTTSWFSGSSQEFVKAAQEMKIERHEGESQKHITSNHWIEIRDSKALAECDLILYQRRLINGVELDFTTWSRRINLMERRDGEWKIWKRMSVYEKDRVDPVDPSAMPKDFFSSVDFSKYPQQIRYHCWRNDVAGFPPAHDICVKGTEAETKVRQEARRWIE